MTFQVPQRNVASDVNNSTSAADFVLQNSLASFFANPNLANSNLTLLESPSLSNNLTEQLVCDENNYFSCHVSKTCLLKHHICDNMIDCWDGSDELNCNNSTTVTFEDRINSDPTKAKTCGGTIFNDNSDIAIITHSQYPGHYRSNLECVWTFDQIPENSVVVIEFNEFNLEYSADCASSDHLEFRFGNGLGSKFLCGYLGTKHFVSRRMTLAST